MRRNAEKNRKKDRREEEEREERRRRQDEEREARRQEREIRKLQQEADIMRQKEAAEIAKREHELELARIAARMVMVVQQKEMAELKQLNSPHSWMVRMIWTPICRRSRDLPRQLSGKKMDGHRSLVLCCLDEH